MSRIGKQPIQMPTTVKASINDGIITVEGPKGKLSQSICKDINVEIGEAEIIVTRANEEKPTKSAHGLMRQLIANMVVGVSEGYQKKLLIVGVGYKAEFKNNELVLSLGFANEIEYIVPAGITISCPDANSILIAGIDKQLVGQTAAEIRSLKKPEPYKGKGIKYDGEFVRSKSGKAGRV